MRRTTRLWQPGRTMLELENWRNWNIIIINNHYCQSPLSWGGGARAVTLLPEMKTQLEIYRTDHPPAVQPSKTARQPTHTSDTESVNTKQHKTRQTWPELDGPGLHDVTSALTWPIRAIIFIIYNFCLRSASQPSTTCLSLAPWLCYYFSAEIFQTFSGPRPGHSPPSSVSPSYFHSHLANISKFSIWPLTRVQHGDISLNVLHILLSNIF